MTERLRTLVRSALDRALEAGLNLRDWKPVSVTQDLIKYDEDLREFNASDILPYVTEWQSDHRR